MSVVDLSDVQQWLEQTKLLLTDLDPSLTATAEAVAFGIVGDVYDTSTWVDEATTPAIIKVAIGYLIAAWEYNRHYSENSGPADYGLYLEGKGMALLTGLKDGTYDLLEVPGTTVSSLLAFYPDDAAGAAETYNGMGELIGAAGNQDIHFYMGAKW